MVLTNKKFCIVCIVISFKVDKAYSLLFQRHNYHCSLSLIKFALATNSLICSSEIVFIPKKKSHKNDFKINFITYCWFFFKEVKNTIFALSLWLYNFCAVLCEVRFRVEIPNSLSSYVSTQELSLESLTSLFYKLS